MKMLWLIPAFLLIAVGCHGGGQTRRIEYSVKNATGQDVQNVAVGIGDRHFFRHGNLISGSHSGFAGQMSVVPENTVTFDWTGADGKNHKATLSVPRKMLLDEQSCQFVIGRDMQVRQEWRFPAERSDEKGSISTYNVGR
jgi:hypothetical protein